MSIYTLTCEKRDLAVKAKKIRQNGLVPAVVYGRNIDSLSIQVNKNVAAKFLKSHSIGSQVLLQFDGEEQLALLKEFQRDPLSQELLHIDFHALTTGEKVKVNLPISYIHRDSLDKDIFLQEQMSEIEISTLPKYLIDSVKVDLSKYSLGDSVYVSDLDVSSDENMEVLSPSESLVCTLTHAVKFMDEEPEEETGEDEAETAEETETTEE